MGTGPRPSLYRAWLGGSQQALLSAMLLGAALRRAGGYHRTAPSRAYSHRSATRRMATKEPPSAEAAARVGNFLERLGSPKAVCAPMVQQSELAFRLLVRRYGVQLAYTPMLSSKSFFQDEVYRATFWDGLDTSHSMADRPLIAQFCGDAGSRIAQSARHIEKDVDAVDLNLGCPQKIARRGHYGAFLLHEPRTVRKIVSTLVSELSVPITAKIRVMPSESETLDFVKMLEDAGCQMVAVHARTREQNKLGVGEPSWDMIRKIKQSISIPVIANGGIETYEDYRRCLSETGADAVMSSEALLENPALFLSEDPHMTDYDRAQRQLGFAIEYLDLAQQHWPAEGVASIKGHLFKLLYRMVELPGNHDIRQRLGATGNGLLEYRSIVAELQDRYATESQARTRCEGKVLSDISWYRRHRNGMELTKALESQGPTLQERLQMRKAAAAGDAGGAGSRAVGAVRQDVGIRAPAFRERMKGRG